MKHVAIVGYIDPPVWPGKLKDGTKITSALVNDELAQKLEDAGLLAYSEDVAKEDIPEKYLSANGELFHAFASHPQKKETPAKWEDDPELEPIKIEVGK